MFSFVRRDLFFKRDELCTWNLAHILIQTSFRLSSSFISIHYLSITALINVAFNVGDENWRLVWLENRLRFVEGAENLTYHIPGNYPFRHTIPCPGLRFSVQVVLKDVSDNLFLANRLQEDPSGLVPKRDILLSHAATG